MTMTRQRMEKPNYPTYAVGLWIDNDEDSQRHAEKLTSLAVGKIDAAQRVDPDPCSPLVYFLARDLRDWIFDESPGWKEGVRYTDGLKGLYPDLLRATLEDVDWERIARCLIEGYDS